MDDTIREILRLTGWSQGRLAEELGTSQSIVSRWLQGSEPRGHTRDEIRELLDRLRDREQGGGSSIVSTKVVRVPLLSWVSAGSLAPPDSVVDAADAKPIYVAGLDPAGDWIALRVDGSSMNRISPPASIIVANRKDRRLVANACYVIATVDNGEASYKRFRPEPRRFEPVSTEEHPTLFVDHGNDPVIIGRVRRTILDL